MVTELEISVFIPIAKKANAKECSNYRTIALISHASKVMLKIIQAGLQQYMNHNFQTFRLDLEKAEEPEIKLVHILLKPHLDNFEHYFASM